MRSLVFDIANALAGRSNLERKMGGDFRASIHCAIRADQRAVAINKVLASRFQLGAVVHVFQILEYLSARFRFVG